VSRVESGDDNLINNITRIAVAYLGNTNTNISPKDVVGFVRNLHDTLSVLELGSGGGTSPLDVKEGSLNPAVPIARSVCDDYLICLEDGRKLKMLRRYLRSRYKMTPDEYRLKWGLPDDYPMVSSNYAAQRSALAMQSGLGRRRAKPRKMVGKAPSPQARGSQQQMTT